MAADFKFVKALWGHTQEIDTATADEALEAGDIGNFDASSEIEKVDDNADEDDLVLVLADADADDTGVPFMWLDPGIIIEGTMVGTLGKVGDIVGIDVTSNVIKVEAMNGSTLPGKFMIRKIVNSTNQIVQVSRTYRDVT